MADRPVLVEEEEEEEAEEEVGRSSPTAIKIYQDEKTEDDNLSRIISLYIYNIFLGTINSAMSLTRQNFNNGMVMHNICFLVNLVK